MAIAERRLQIYLPEKDYKVLKARARSEGRSMAHLIREAVAQYAVTPDKEKIRKGYESLSKIVGMFSDGAGVAENHDEFLGKLDRW